MTGYKLDVITSLGSFNNQVSRVQEQRSASMIIYKSCACLFFTVVYGCLLPISEYHKLFLSNAGVRELQLGGAQSIFVAVRILTLQGLSAKLYLDDETYEQHSRWRLVDIYMERKLGLGLMVGVPRSSPPYMRPELFS